ncbi:hypothetical protein GQ53DRAFT_741568 [Thozetella sp. PMI_491]|nr:hypothetical protein GQ53DRAFT_741568 [Thozetella sp. PMI_491]
MVNTGKPSGGCKLCRARRIKCDERKPFCMRCEKSKRQCPGYRDPFETKIRDETAATINKFAGRAPRDGVHPELQWVHYVARQGQWEQPTPPPEFFEEGFDYDELVNQICASLTTPVDQQASCHFLSDFVLLPSQPKLYGYHRYIFGLLQRDRVLPAFESAFKCVSFASLSRRPNCKPLQLQAQALYIKALKEVSRALNDPTQAKSDQLLGAVLLLAVYEVTTDFFACLSPHPLTLSLSLSFARARLPNKHEKSD